MPAILRCGQIPFYTPIRRPRRNIMEGSLQGADALAARRGRLAPPSAGMTTILRRGTVLRPIRDVDACTNRAPSMPRQAAVREQTAPASWTDIGNGGISQRKCRHLEKKCRHLEKKCRHLSILSTRQKHPVHRLGVTCPLSRKTPIC